MRQPPSNPTLLFVAVATSAGCMSQLADQSMMDNGAMNRSGVMTPPPWEGPFETSVAADQNPADDVVEVNLEAKESTIELAQGHRVQMWTYNGVLPGPRIEARIGNTVRVHFRNSLSQPTTIHWHGVRVPNAMDGSLAVQAPIAPGGEFTYEFVVPDAGTFWYHPHFRSDQQVERGLYGAIVVRGDDEPATTTDRTVVLDDVLVDPTSWQLAPFGAMMDVLSGREGNVILANGRAHPVAEAPPGGIHRFRFINSANARYFRLALPGHRLTMIGTDGGLLEAPREVDDVLLVPGERVDLLVTGDSTPGTALEWKTLPYDRGEMMGMMGSRMGITSDATIFDLKNTSDPPTSTPPVPAVLTGIPELPVPSARRDIRFEQSMRGRMGRGGSSMMGSAFSFNGINPPDMLELQTSLDSTEDWALVNTTSMDHPFHLHGFRFQVVSAAAAVPPFRAWRDTVNVPAMQTVVVRIRFEDRPGIWMFHCHILEHAENGMMGEVHVQ